jgi:adenine-specific DNA-methyltransferase
LRKKIDGYLESGETSGYHLRNQLARRNPWYLSEHVIATELGMFKRSHIHPILFHKPADIYSTDTIYRVWIKSEMEADVSPRQLAFSFINSLTFLSSEMVGRSYGGGVLELTPKEIRSIKIPPFKCSDEEFQTLDTLLKDGKGIEEILDYTDSIILHFLTADEKKLLRTMWEKLNIRRRNRSKRGESNGP